MNEERAQRHIAMIQQAAAAEQVVRSMRFTIQCNRAERRRTKKRRKPNGQ